MTHFPFRSLRIQPTAFALASACVLLGSSAAHAQTTYIYESNPVDGTISRYNLDGSLENGSFISGLDQPTALNSDVADFPTDPSLFITLADQGTGHPSGVLKYSATTGQAVAGFTPITSVSPLGVADAVYYSGNLYVSNFNGQVNVYNPSTGALLTTNTIGTAGFQGVGVNISSKTNTLYISDEQNGTVSAYPLSAFATSGGLTITPPIITGLDHPQGMAIDAAGNFLYVSNSFTNTIGRFDLTNNSYISNYAMIPNSGVTESPDSLRISIDGKTLYAVSPGKGTVDTFDISDPAALSAPVLVDGFINPPPSFQPLDVIELSVVPEPTSIVLLLSSGLTLAMARRRRATNLA